MQRLADCLGPFAAQVNFNGVRRSQTVTTCFVCHRHFGAPLLLIVGEEDLHTTLAESRRLFAAAPEPKTLWVLPGAAHTNFHGFAGADYERRVLDFLAANLTGR